MDVYEELKELYDSTPYRKLHGAILNTACQLSIPCRGCGEMTQEDENVCISCLITAPGIYSTCPTCGARDYIHKPYGWNFKASFAGMVIAGPLGLLAGGIRQSKTECVCLKCGQGWLPFDFPGGKWNVTRKFDVAKVKAYASELKKNKYKYSTDPYVHILYENMQKNAASGQNNGGMSMSDAGSVKTSAANSKPAFEKATQKTENIQRSNTEKQTQADTQTQTAWQQPETTVAPPKQKHLFRRILLLIAAFFIITGGVRYIKRINSPTLRAIQISNEVQDYSLSHNINHMLKDTLPFVGQKFILGEPEYFDRLNDQIAVEVTSYYLVMTDPRDIIPYNKDLALIPDDLLKEYMDQLFVSNYDPSKFNKDKCWFMTIIDDTKAVAVGDNMPLAFNPTYRITNIKEKHKGEYLIDVYYRAESQIDDYVYEMLIQYTLQDDDQTEYLFRIKNMKATPVTKKYKKKYIDIEGF